MITETKVVHASFTEQFWVRRFNELILTNRKKTGKWLRTLQNIEEHYVDTILYYKELLMCTLCEPEENNIKCHLLAVKLGKPNLGRDDLLQKIKEAVVEVRSSRFIIKTLKIKSFLRVMLRFTFIHSEFPQCHHIISLILSAPVYCPSRIWTLSYQYFWN